MAVPGGSSLTLALDASTTLGTVALISGTKVLAEGETRMRGEAGERLLPTVELVLARAGARAAELTEVVCGSGPGSFTSLRIAAGVAKGLCHARELPLFAVSSLLLLVAARGAALLPGGYLAALDAMRDEAFIMEVEVRADGTLIPGSTRRMPVADARAYAASRNLHMLGVLSGDDAVPHARGVATLRERSNAADTIRRVSLDSWEPEYGRLAEAQVKWEAAHGRALS